MLNPVRLAIGAGVLSLFAFFKGRSSATEKNDTSSDVIKDAEKDTDKYQIVHSESWFSQTADLMQTQLLQAWKSNDAINSVLTRLIQLKNKDEYLHLIKKFGLRSGFGVSYIYKEPLTKWLVYFLDNRYSFYSEKQKRTLHTTGLKVAKWILRKKNIDLV